jgi:hypothetical protein
MADRRPKQLDMDAVLPLVQTPTKARAKPARAKAKRKPPPATGKAVA